MGHVFSSRAAETPTCPTGLTGSGETLGRGKPASRFVAKLNSLQEEQPDSLQNSDWVIQERHDPLRETRQIQALTTFRGNDSHAWHHERIVQADFAAALQGKCLPSTSNGYTCSSASNSTSEMGLTHVLDPEAAPRLLHFSPVNDVPPSPRQLGAILHSSLPPIRHVCWIPTLSLGSPRDPSGLSPTLPRHRLRKLLAATF